MNCEYCGKEFAPVINPYTGCLVKNQKFCSAKCRRKNYYNKNKDRFILYAKKYQKKNRKNGLNCIVCGKPLPKKRRRFCSWECYYSITHKRPWKLSPFHMGDILVCPVCGKNFSLHAPGQIYCSEECRKKVTYEKIRKHQKLKIVKYKVGNIIECRSCGEDFVLTKSGYRYCEYCREKKRDYQNALTGYDDEPNRCQLCGGILRGNQYVICEECAKVSKRTFDQKLIFTGEVVDRLFPVGG